MKVTAQCVLTKYFTNVLREQTLSDKIQIFANGRGSRAFGIFVFLRKSGYSKDQRRPTVLGKLFACASDLADKYISRTQQISTSSIITNEPAKSESYMEMSQNTTSIIAALNKGYKIPHIKVIAHPYNSSKNIVVNGNHRVHAFRKLNMKEVPAVKIPYKNVVLMKSEWGKPKEPLGTLDQFLNNKNVIDMYFVQPNGANKFITS